MHSNFDSLEHLLSDPKTTRGLVFSIAIAETRTIFNYAFLFSTVEFSSARIVERPNGELETGRLKESSQTADRLIQELIAAGVLEVSSRTTPLQDVTSDGTLLQVAIKVPQAQNSFTILNVQETELEAFEIQRLILDAVKRLELGEHIPIT